MPAAQLLEPDDIAKRFGDDLKTAAGRAAFWRKIHNWSIPHFRLGPRTVRFSAEEFDAWLNTRHVGRAVDARTSGKVATS